MVSVPLQCPFSNSMSMFNPIRTNTMNYTISYRVGFASPQSYNHMVSLCNLPYDKVGGFIILRNYDVYT